MTIRKSGTRNESVQVEESASIVVLSDLSDEADTQEARNYSEEE